MRTSALLTFIFAAISAPSLAAPIWSMNRCDRVPAFCELGLGSIGPIPFNTNVLSGNKSNQQRGCDEDEGSGTIIFPPSTYANLNGTIRGHLPFPPPVYGPGLYVGDHPSELKRSRDLHELILRAINDESGAIDWKKWGHRAKDALSIILGTQGYTAPPPPADVQQPTDQQGSTDEQQPSDEQVPAYGQQQPQQRRELFEHVAREYNDVFELLARAAADDESGAGLFSTIGTDDSPLNHMYISRSNSQRRAMIELLARAAQDDESGADFLGVLGDVGNAFLKIFGRDNNQRREMVELLTRATQDEESGASFTSVIGDIGNAFLKIFGRDNNQRREMVELLARAAEDDESGAGLLDFITGLFTRDSNQQQQRRDLAAVVELLARANYDLE